MLVDMESELTEYDEEVIRSIIEHVDVLSETELKIYLRGELAVKETLPKYHTGRCKTTW